MKSTLAGSSAQPPIHADFETSQNQCQKTKIRRIESPKQSTKTLAQTTSMTSVQNQTLSLNNINPIAKNSDHTHEPITLKQAFLKQLSECKSTNKQQENDTTIPPQQYLQLAVGLTTLLESDRIIPSAEGAQLTPQQRRTLDQAGWSTINSTMQSIKMGSPSVDELQILDSAAQYIVNFIADNNQGNSYPNDAIQRKMALYLNLYSQQNL